MGNYPALPQREAFTRKMEAVGGGYDLSHEIRLLRVSLLDNTDRWAAMMDNEDVDQMALMAMSAVVERSVERVAKLCEQAAKIDVLRDNVLSKDDVSHALQQVVMIVNSAKIPDDVREAIITRIGNTRVGGVDPEATALLENVRNPDEFL